MTKHAKTCNKYLSIEEREEREQFYSDRKLEPPRLTEVATMIGEQPYYINAKRYGESKQACWNIINNFNRELLSLFSLYEHLYCICNLSLRVTHNINDTGLMSKVISKIKYRVSSKYKINHFVYLWVREEKDDNRHYHLTVAIPDINNPDESEIIKVIKNAWIVANSKLTGKVKMAYTIKPLRYIYRVTKHSSEMADLIYHNSYLAKKYTKPARRHIKTHGVSKIKI